MKNEQCWVLIGKRRGKRFWSGKYDRYTEGQPATVAFDPDYVWENRDRIVGWLHTHPQWIASPSCLDHATMTAQVASLGRPMLCCIQGTDGLRAWWYFDDESPGAEGSVKRIGKRLYGIVPTIRPEPELVAAAGVVEIASDDEVAEMESRYERMVRNAGELDYDPRERPSAQDSPYWGDGCGGAW